MDEDCTWNQDRCGSKKHGPYEGNNSGDPANDPPQELEDSRHVLEYVEASYALDGVSGVKDAHG